MIFKSSGSLKFLLLTVSLSIFFLPANLYSKETVRVGTYENSPKIFTDEQGKVSGFWADITNYIAEKEDWKIEWVHGTWDECLERLEKNEIDLMVDTGWNEERSQKFIFTKETVLLSWSALYVQNGFVFQSINDLKGRKIGVMKNSINYSGPDGIKNLLEKFEIDCEFVEFESYIDVFKAIENKKVDAGVTNKQFGEMNENEFIMKTSMEFLPSKLLYALPMNPERSNTLIEKIDLRIRELKSDEESVYYKSMNKWYGKIVANSYIPVWVYWGLGVLISGIVALYILNILLSRIIRKKTEELKLANAEMEKKVIERTSELSEANIKLKELDHLKSMFIASMSHELRTPLNSIIGFTGLILQGISGKIDDAAKEDLEIVYNSSKHLLSLINDVIDISKIEADKIDVFYEEFELKSVIDEVVTTVSKEADKKKIAIKTEVPEGLTVNSDRKRLFQCVLNLVGNSVKYSEKGTVTIAAKKTAEKLKISVSDTGIGIRKEDIPKLFKSFIRLDSHIKDTTLGTGLGLYLTKKIVTGVLHGDIRVESSHGEWSIFTIEIPLNTEA